MTDEEEIALAKRIPKGAKRALLAMTAIPTLPGKATFNANGAFNLTWFARTHGGLAQYVVQKGRAAYSLTPLGERIQARIASGMEARQGGNEVPCEARQPGPKGTHKPSPDHPSEIPVE